jgi:HSP20 family protein
LTIRGKRTPEFPVSEENYFWKECFWGSFSRSIILPVDVETSKIKAAIKNGVLTIMLPKAKKKRAIKVKTVSENNEAEKIA